MSTLTGRRFAVLFLGLAVLLGSAAPARAADTVWTGTAAGSWGNAGNWSSGVPNASMSASTGGAGADILLGASAQATTLFVDGPVGGESQLSSGTLTLSNQLWINVASGTADPTILRLYDGGSAPVSVTADKASIGVDPGQPGGVILDSRAGGSVTLSVVDTLTIGYDGSGSYVYSWPAIPSPAGAVSISAATIQTSVLATAGATDYNYIGTYTSGATLAATNLAVGVAGQQGGAENYGGNWSVVNTEIGVQSTAGSNYITVADGGTFTNTGVFTVGVTGSNNAVYVGYAAGATSPTGTLAVTGPNDLVIGAANTADGNQILVDLGGALAVTKNVVVGVDGHANQLIVDNASSVTSGGARLGANAGSGGNSAVVKNNSNWSSSGVIRVGSSGTGNSFSILSGGTVTLTAPGKNFFVGYENSASGNTLTISGTGSTLKVKAIGADVVVSANATGTATPPYASGNQIVVSDGGLLDANRTIASQGGTITGDGGTIGGNVLVLPGGTIAPGGGGPTFIGSLSVLGNVDLSNGGSFDVTISGTQSDFLDVGGTLTLGGASTLALNMSSYEAFRPYVIARYGTLSGAFASITGLPAGALINYNYLGLNEIAVIAIPEIGTAATGTALALLGGVLGLSERRRRRRM